MDKVQKGETLECSEIPMSLTDRVGTGEQREACGEVSRDQSPRAR